MKKVLSVFLAIIMAFSVCVTASAQTDTVKTGETKTVIIPSSGEVSISFNAVEKGIYVLKTKTISSGKLVFSVMHGSNCTVKDSYFRMQTVYNKDMYFCADDNSTFDIVIYDYERFYKDETTEPGSPITCEFVIEKYNFSEAVVGSNKSDGTDDYALFIPENSGYYNFLSNAPENETPSIRIYDSDGPVGADTRTRHDVDNDFDYTVYLEKGRAYSLYFVNDNEFSYTISYDKKIEVEDIIVEHDEYSLVPLPCNRGVVGDEAFWPIYVIPHGATPYAGLTVKSSNEKVVSVSFSGSGVAVKYNKPGAAMVAVTTANGIMYQIPVIVISETLFELEDRVLTELMYAFHFTLIVAFLTSLFTIFPW